MMNYKLKPEAIALILNQYLPPKVVERVALSICDIQNLLLEKHLETLPVVHLSKVIDGAEIWESGYDKDAACSATLVLIEGQR